MVNSNSKNLKKLRELVDELPIRDAEVFQMVELLKLTLDVTTDGYWDWDISNNTEYLSSSFKGQSGYNDNEMESSPEAWQKLMHPDDLKEAFRLFNEHVDSKGKVEYKLQARYTHKLGHEIKILCRGSVIEWGENNDPLRMVGTHIDITNIKEL